MADLVDDEPRGLQRKRVRPCRRPSHSAQAMEAFGEAARVDAASGLNHLHTQGGAAGSGRTQEVNHVTSSDEAEQLQCQDPIRIRRWSEREVEAGQCPDGSRAARTTGRLDATVLADCRGLGPPGPCRSAGHLGASRLFCPGPVVAGLYAP